MSTAREGWYVDPSTGTNLRFWNGTTWTEEVAPLPGEEPPSPPLEEASEPVAPLALDPELERTRLTRRELRARRGTDANLDDAPRHLPPAPPPVTDATHESLQPEVTEIPVAAILEHPQADDREAASDDSSERRIRAVRLSVLLGILAVASSVAVFTTVTM